MARSCHPDRDSTRPGAAPAGRAAAPPRVLARLAASADIRFNGDQPCDIRVHDPDLYRRILTHGSLGLGEAYMDGLWDAERLDETMTRLIRVGARDRLPGLVAIRRVLAYLHGLVINRQSRRRACEVGERHYDIGNDLYQAMLDPTMSYSCAYWPAADTLAQAQRAKLDLICRKLELAPGERLLDIGCGWGGLAEYAARGYGVEVLGITISRRQFEFATARCRGLPVAIRLMDYRELTGRFDKIVSVGMFEHVGPKNYRAYFRTAAALLAEQGLMLLHTIGSSATARATDPWIHKHIFPNGYIPSARQLSAALERRLVLEDWHCFGPDYDRTLQAWWANFEAAWPTLDRDRYDLRFYRMWKFYLHACMGYFRSRQGQLWQLVLSKPTRAGVYRSLR